MELYGKNAVIRPFTAMQRSGRFVHSYIIIGEHGVGKRTSALYAACMLLCDNKCACGECVQCRRVLKNEHPDLRIVERSKKSYSVDDVREVVTDSFTSPNDCDRKIYLFTDCDGWSDAAQNALLKAVEDPPDPVYFIFTGIRAASFLGTLVSRSMVLNINPAGHEECMAALRERFPDRDETELERVSKALGGNIGSCVEYLEGSEELMERVELVRRISACAAQGDEYTVSALLNSVSSDRSAFEECVDMFGTVIRDAVSLSLGRTELLGCDEEGAKKLSAFDVRGLVNIYDACTAAADSCAQNCNTPAAAGLLASRIVRSLRF